MQAVVSAFRNSDSGHEVSCTVISREGSAKAESGLNLSIFDTVELKDGKVTSILDSQDGKNAYSESMKSIEERLAITGKAPASRKGDSEYIDLLNRMMPSINSAALKIAKAYISGAPIVVRYHNDGDGVSGAIAIYRALSGLVERKLCEERTVSWQMNRGVAYTIDSFYSDKAMFSAFSSAERPLLVITDFGSTGESTAQVEASVKEFDIVWIDHHVIPPDFIIGSNVLYINPFNSGGDSKLTAGLISAILAESIGAACADLKEAALISDYSPYGDKKSAEGKKIALILDYLTSRRPGMEDSPKSIDRILQDKERMETMFMSAGRMLEEALDAGIRSMTRYTSDEGINVAVVDFANVAKLGHEYPLPGRYSSKLQDVLEATNLGKTITLVHYSSYISIRMSRDITSRVDILKVIADLSKSTDGGLSGGGHREAASIKIGTYSMVEALSLLLAQLKVRV